MYHDINFLSKQQIQFKKRDKLDKKSFYVVIVLTIIVLIIFGSLWFTNNWYQNQIKQVKNNQQNLEKTIQANQNREKDYLAFYQKIQKLTELIAQRSQGTTTLINDYNYFTTPTTAIQSTSYDYYTKNLEVTLACNNVFALKQLLDLVQNETYNQKFNYVELLSLMRNSEGVYQLKVNIEL